MRDHDAWTTALVKFLHIYSRPFFNEKSLHCFFSVSDFSDQHGLQSAEDC